MEIDDDDDDDVPWFRRRYDSVHRQLFWPLTFMVVVAAVIARCVSGENVPEVLVESVVRAEEPRVFPSTMFSENLGAESQGGAEPAPVSMSRVSALHLVRAQVAARCSVWRCLRWCAFAACARACLSTGHHA